MAKLSRFSRRVLKCRSSSGWSLRLDQSQPAARKAASSLRTGSISNASSLSNNAMASKAAPTIPSLVGNKRKGKKQQQNKIKPEEKPQPQPESKESTDNQATVQEEVKLVDIKHQIEENPVGRLQELSQHALWPLPSYKFDCSHVDNPSKRQFTCTVQLRSHVARGVGRSKQLAKRASALAMLQQVKSCTETCCDLKKNSTECDKNTIQATTPTELNETKTPPPSPLKEAAFQELRSSKRLQSAAKAGSEVGGLFRGVRNRKAGSVLPPIEPSPSASGPSRPSDQLMELSRQHRFNVQFLDASSGGSSTEGSSSGQQRAVVKLSTMPTIVAVGSGSSAAIAREQACRAAMEYLCSLTRETGPATAGKKA